MPSSACVLWVAIACSASLQIYLAAPAPFQAVHEHIDFAGESSEAPHARADYIFTMRSIRSLSTTPPMNLDDASGLEPGKELPPVSEVLKMMDEKSRTALPMISATTNVPPAPASVSISATSANTQSTENPTGTLQILGLGPVVIPTPISGPEALPPDNATAQVVDNDHHPYPAPVHKLILIGSIMGGFIAVTLCVFVLFNPKAFNVCRTKNRTVQTVQISPFYEARKDGELGSSTDSLDTSSLYNLPMPSATYRPSGKQAALLSPPSPRVLSKVMDITPDFPRSKFSITSSDYALSLRSSTHSYNISMPPLPIIGEEAPPAPPALLPPNEFFCLPSSPDLRRSLSSRHSRNHSAPIFGHDASLQAFSMGGPGRMRAGDHRKSKSISGLVYVVERPASVSASSHRRSTSSKFSQHKGTPPDERIFVCS